MCNFDERVEFALRLDDDEVWIPLAVIFNSDDGTLHPIENLVIRDYSVDSLNQIAVDKSILATNVSLTLCDFERVPESIQFRWLQSSSYQAGVGLQDLWGLDNLKISYMQSSGGEVVLLSDSFDDEQLK